MVQVTKKPVEFSEDIKTIFDIMGKIVVHHTLLTQDVIEFMHYFEELNNLWLEYRSYGKEIRYGDLTYYFDEVFSQLFETIWTDMSWIVTYVKRLQSLDLLKDEYAKPFYRCKEELEKILDFVEPIKDEYEKIESSYPPIPVGEQRAEAIEKLIPLIEKLRPIKTRILLWYDDVKRLVSELLQLYALDPPENTKKDGMGLFEVLALGTMIVGGIIILKNMGM